MQHDIFIVGSRKLHNESLANLLGQETGMRCAAFPDFSRILRSEPGKLSLILIDYPQKDLERMLGSFERPGILTALFNVEPEKGIEEKAIILGIRGIFYEYDSLEQFRKGVSAIFNGELWLSRDVMSKCLLTRKERSNQMGNVEISLLTQRK